MMTVLDGPAGVLAAAGRHLGCSDWLTVDAGMLALFADATGDPESTYLALSLTNLFLPQIVEVRGFAMGVNYGTGRIVQPLGLHVGDRVRGSVELVEVADVPGGLQTTMRITVEIEGREQPACVVDALSRWTEDRPGSAD